MVQSVYQSVYDNPQSPRGNAGRDIAGDSQAGWARCRFLLESLNFVTWKGHPLKALGQTPKPLYGQSLDIKENYLDWQIHEAGFRFVRYADDFVVLCETEEQAQHALDTVHRYAREYALTVHPTKTRIGDSNCRGEGFDFLGYHFEDGKRWASRDKIPALRSRLRPRLMRTNGRSLDCIIADINPTLRGWYEYFQQSHPNVFDTVDGWVRKRLRSILRKRRKRKGNAKGADHQRWPNAFFTAYGLFSLRQAHASTRQSLMGENH